MRDAQAGKFDLVLTESLDRISRDQEDIAGVYKRLRFAGVKMHTLSEVPERKTGRSIKATRPYSRLRWLRVPQLRAGGLVIGTDAFFNSRTEQLAFWTNHR